MTQGREGAHPGTQVSLIRALPIILRWQGGWQVWVLVPALPRSRWHMVQSPPHLSGPHFLPVEVDEMESVEPDSFAQQIFVIVKLFTPRILSINPSTTLYFRICFLTSCIFSHTSYIH